MRWINIHQRLFPVWRTSNYVYLILSRLNKILALPPLQCFYLTPLFLSSDVLWRNFSFCNGVCFFSLLSHTFAHARTPAHSCHTPQTPILTITCRHAHVRACAYTHTHTHGHARTHARKHIRTHLHTHTRFILQWNRGTDLLFLKGREIYL